MIVGIPKETISRKGVNEKRVGLSPAGVRELVDLGAQVYVESTAGAGAGFPDDEYRSSGAAIAYSREEVIRRADLVVKVQRPDQSEWSFFNNEATLLTFLHLAVAPKELVEMLVEKKITAIGLELVRKNDGALPILRASSEIAGQMAVQLAARLLESTAGGRGILLGGIPGIPPPDIVIIGAGTLGYYAARAFLGMGCRVSVLDIDMRKLVRIDTHFGGGIVTALATRNNVEKFTAFADVLIGAALVPGQRAPVIVTKEMVMRMRAGSLILDFSIDQGGCVETSTLTPGEEYLFTAHGVIHFCAPNVPAMVARTSTHALTNALLPYLKEIVQRGALSAIRANAELRRGVCALGGYVAASLPISGLPQADIEKLVRGEL
ncbi:MAG: alanine dehydrogenase [Acidobacteria bacterium]|nr:alanine dehydrogenase [Acidobacteriota bacterium]MBI3655632.1 alanine dehydrogenase [Acidobacteriota bacterium]